MNKENKSRCSRCKNETFDFPRTQNVEKLDRICIAGCSPFPISDDAPCASFDSRFIVFPVTVSNIENQTIRNDLRGDSYCGHLVRISPCAEEYHGKTFVGIYLGRFMLDALAILNQKTESLSIVPENNPAIFVPELKKVVYGSESFWSFVDSEDEIRDITPEDINNCWYVRLLHDIFSEEVAG